MEPKECEWLHNVQMLSSVRRIAWHLGFGSRFDTYWL